MRASTLNFTSPSSTMAVKSGRRWGEIIHNSKTKFARCIAKYRWNRHKRSNDTGLIKFRVCNGKHFGILKWIAYYYYSGLCSLSGFIKTITYLKLVVVLPSREHDMTGDLFCWVRRQSYSQTMDSISTEGPNRICFSRTLLTYLRTKLQYREWKRVPSEHKSAFEALVLRLNTWRQADTVTVTWSKLALCSPHLIMFVVKSRRRDGLVLQPSQAKKKF